MVDDSTNHRSPNSLDRGVFSSYRAQFLTTDRQDSGLAALVSIAKHYQISIDSSQLKHDLALGEQYANSEDIVRAALRMGMRSRLIRNSHPKKLHSVPLPAILCKTDGTFRVLLSRQPDGKMVTGDPVTRVARADDFEAILAEWNGELVLIARRWFGPGTKPAQFGFSSFLPSLWRYRFPLTQVLVASLFIQLFALVTPLLFQVVIDKVLVHKSFSTLLVIVIGLVCIGLFDVTLQYLRSYILNHTTSRIDVELGSQLFSHMIRLPLSYFEARATGQTVARVRELETIRTFLTGQGLSSVIDLIFVSVFIIVMFAYSGLLTLIVILTIPFYILIAIIIRPHLLNRVNERFDTAAATQQFLVESVVGVQTIKGAAVEPILRQQWDERLASYVRSSFQAVQLSNLGQNAIQYVSKASTAAVLFFGAKAVTENELTVGGLIAFNMLMGQVTTPILRLSQLWQDFQQVQVSVQRLGDIMNVTPENDVLSQLNLPLSQGSFRLLDVSFRYRNDGAPVLNGINLDIPAGEVLGIVGPSGSGKSTLTKLLQRFYQPTSGQIMIDGVDISHVDIAWLRRQVGVVLQESLLFNRSIHDNIALSNPGMSRMQVIASSRLSGADDFIVKLPRGYDTIIEERGANLSGGQRQRISIARALANDPRILIFDEATSALDYESEQIIQANMRKIVRGRTVIIIAHRLTAVKRCNRIIAIENGAIVEQGTHRELLYRENGLYARLWRAQTQDL